mmetsp:Transcript_15297/g.28550  ORF Transcript_15297/g.28550 Transcript_15297/m.28550 type:complete len:306 (+) Transcript_15297:78-995(+)|eukprot:CAMPEP_0178743878 /NCGR_PEP_ID=MMETSP0744-20121128/6442_1 /TAXON_ID=913974 /ORGANISM="Nitzschia punctata, Strain CCMP561" /LENGTH=305 /DNA_ID=CAMNT_0020396915 /DNA_START=1 /DNA_END=918 /DNA_ORIENTATION=+
MDFQRAATPTSIGAVSTRTTSLNDRLNTEYVNFGKDENSFSAQYTRAVTGFVGEFITPRQLLVVLRILKAVTFCFLILTICADMMYIVFVEVLATREVRDVVGGRRDMIIRVYGLFLAAAAIAIEIDVSWFLKPFYGLKGFIPRSFLLFFISAITGAHPLQLVQNERDEYQAQNNYQVDDAVADDAVADDAAAGDDAVAVYDDLYFYQETNSVPDVPGSAIVFQMVTSFVLGVCAVAYFVFGLLCLDRFTSKAYLSSNDPLVSTAIPQPTSSAYHSARDDTQTNNDSEDSGGYRHPQDPPQATDY